MQLTKFISGLMVENWKLLPIILMLLIWWFFTGFREILKKPRYRWRRELLFSVSVFGFAYSLMNFGVFGLVDPANRLAKPGAVPVPPEDFIRFEWMAYGSMAVAIIAFVCLEISFALERRGERSVAGIREKSNS